MAHNRTFSGHHRKPRVMRSGKTTRDHASGAWDNHRRNKDWRRHERGTVMPGSGHRSNMEP
jgi:hypothetical protein